MAKTLARHLGLTKSAGLNNLPLERRTRKERATDRDVFAYIEGVAELLTKLYAKSTSGAAGFAGRQASAAVNYLLLLRQIVAGTHINVH